MKKRIKIILLLVVGFVLFMGKQVYAASASISASTTNAYVGDTVTITVSYYACTWNLTVSGSVNDVIAGADMNGNVGGSQSYYLSPSSPGSYTVSLSGDVSDFDTDATTYPSGSVTVNFSERPAPPPAPDPSPSPSTVTVRPSSNPTTPSEDGKSTNNSLKSLKVEGYEIVKVDDTHYTLSVKNAVDRITIKAEVEDSKAKVGGDGSRTINVGENTLEVVVTAEDGSTKTYVITVTRRADSFTLQQMDNAITDADGNEVDIVLEKDEVLSNDDLDKIKKSNKTFHFTRYDEDKSALYTWTIEGSKINGLKEFNTNISFDLKDRTDFENAMEYYDGMILNLLQNGSLPKGVRLRVYVGDKYKDSDSLNLFYYDSNSKTRKRVSDVKLSDGYLTFQPDKGGAYFLTKASFEKEKTFNIFIPISILEFIAIILLVLFWRRKKVNKKEKSKDSDSSSHSMVQPVSSVMVNPDNATTPKN